MSWANSMPGTRPFRGVPKILAEYTTPIPSGQHQVGLVEHPAKLRVLLGGQEELRVGGDHIVELVLLQQLPPPLGGLLPGQVVKGDP